MLGTIWLLLLLLGVGAAAASGRVGDVSGAAARAASEAVETTIALAGVMALWTGLMRIAERAGLAQALARLLRPLVRRLFPELPPDHPALGPMVMNVSANLLGLGSAATPFGLKAMQELARECREEGTATPAMITFLTLNTASFTLVPGTMIAMRAAAGAQVPADVLLPTLVASLGAGAVGLLVNAALRARQGG